MGGRSWIAAIPLYLFLASFCLAQGVRVDHSYNLFGGMSYQGSAIHGGNASFAFPIFPRISLVADFSAHQQEEAGFATDILYGLFGGQISIGEFAHLRPFTRLTAGLSHLRCEGPVSTNPLVTQNHTGFVVGFGGGIDSPWTDRFKFRMIQIDYLTQPQASEYGDLRASFGIVFSF